MHYICKIRLVFVLLLIIVLAGCGESATEQLSSARPTSVTAPISASLTPSPTEAVEVVPTTVPTEVPTVIPKPLSEATVKTFGFAQNKQQLAFGVLIENPNVNAALEDVKLQVVVYGDGNVVLSTDDSTIPVLPPGVQTHFGSDIYLIADQTVQRIEVQITDGGEPQPATSEELPPFPVEAVIYRETSFSQQVSGVIVNPFTLSLTNLYVGIVLFDESDQIVGGGFTFLSALAPGGKAPFATNVLASSTPARVEVSPLVSVLTLFGQREVGDLPPLKLVEQGWGISEQVGYGVVVENPDSTKGMEGAQYNAAAYAEDGTVIAVDTGYFGLILPGSNSARGGVMYLSSDSPLPSRVEVQVFPGRLVEVDSKKAFILDEVNYVPGQFGAKITGKITNPYDEVVENVGINAILRDASGAIIGGGSGFSETIPANGTAAVEVSVSGGEAAMAELFGNEVVITKIGKD